MQFFGDRPQVELAGPINWEQHSRFEASLRKAHASSGGSCGALADASYWTRQQHARESLPPAFLDVVAGVAGPLLTSYTVWALLAAQARGLRRLYFLSREGDVLFELATILAPRLELAIELRQLYVSRPAINVALLSDFRRADLAWALTHTGSMSLASILERVCLQASEVQDHLEGIGLGRDRWNTRITDDEFSALVDLLASLSHAGVGQLIKERSRQRRERVARYLASAGVFDDVKVGLVDTAGTGSQVRTVHRLRQELTAEGTEGFLVRRMWRPHLDEQGFPPIHSYLSDHCTGTGFRDMDGMNHMLEIFTVTDYGTVIGYADNDGEVVPVFQEPVPERSEMWTSDYMRRPLMTFAQTLSLTSWNIRNAKAPCSGIMEAFRQFWYDPTEAEANYWGQFPYEVGAGDCFRCLELAPQLGLREMIALKRGRRVEKVIVNPWYAGISKRASLYVAGSIAALRHIRRASRALRRVVRRFA